MRINHQELVILIDTGSTHNFLDTSIWMLLKLPMSIKDSFEVKIANGTMVKTKRACHEVSQDSRSGIRHGSQFIVFRWM